MKHFAAALQLDPDNTEAARKYKTLRKIISETTRIRIEIEKAITGDHRIITARTLPLLVSILSRN